MQIKPPKNYFIDAYVYKKCTHNNFNKIYISSLRKQVVKNAAINNLQHSHVILLFNIM